MSQQDNEQQDSTKDQSEDINQEDDKSTDDVVEDQSKEDGEEEESKESQEDEDDLDLERAKAKISKANDEAKNLRTRLRETEDKLKEAKTPEEVEAIVRQMTEEREAAERDLLVENVALKFRLPEKAHKRLTGNTREELEADAKELAELFGTDEDDGDFDLEGGLTPRSREDDSENDPRALARKYGRGSKSR